MFHSVWERGETVTATPGSAEGRGRNVGPSAPGGKRSADWREQEPGMQDGGGKEGRACSEVRPGAQLLQLGAQWARAGSQRSGKSRRSRDPFLMAWSPASSRGTTLGVLGICLEI